MLDEQHRLLANPWEFKGFVTRLNFRSTLLQGYRNRPSSATGGPAPSRFS